MTCLYDPVKNAFLEAGGGYCGIEISRHHFWLYYKYGVTMRSLSHRYIASFFMHCFLYEISIDSLLACGVSILLCEFKIILSISSTSYRKIQNITELNSHFFHYPYWKHLKCQHHAHGLTTQMFSRAFLA